MEKEKEDKSLEELKDEFNEVNINIKKVISELIMIIDKNNREK